MSTSEVNTTSGPLGSNLRETKREACDRCRSKKQRCLRKDQSQDSPQAKCVRCFKAGANCNYGIPVRAGRPSRSTDRRPKEMKIASRHVVDASGHSGFLNSKADLGHDRRGTPGRGIGGLGKAVDQESEETEDMNTANPLGPSSMRDTSNVLGEVNLDSPAFPGSLTAMLHWPSETLPPFCGSDGGEASGFEPFGSEYGWVFHQYQAQPIDTQIPTASPMRYNKQSRDAAINADGTPPQNGPTNEPISSLLEEAMNINLPTESPYVTPLNRTKLLDVRSDQLRDKERETRGISTSSIGMNSIVKSALLENFAEKEAGIELDEESFSVNQVQHWCMHELSELAMNLYKQLVAHDPGDYQPTSDVRPAVFQDQLVGSVLKSSNTFLMLLTSIFSLRPSPSLNLNNSTYSSIGGETLHTNDFTPPSSILIDVTTTLQLLVCHLRILRLHSIMYARILNYVLAFLPLPITPTITQSVDSIIPPVFLDMQVGGVSLDKFGMFQIKLVLQISLHVLGKIELVLDLPEECRIGENGRDKLEDHGGLLEADPSMAFVELMREKERVRKQLDCLREIFKGTIEL
ncbi:hypothetical protein MMC14_010481 [Varicellaria rhodocarpa]|nr:hypothetical protein [Varicellaria rhodocarpa]